MLRQLAVLPMYRHEEARLDKGNEEFELLLAAVAGHVHMLRALGDDVGASPGNMVHHSGNGLFIARNDAR